MSSPPGNRSWLSPLIVAALVAGFGVWCNTRLRHTIEGQLRADLSTVIEANVTALQIWTTNQFNLATAIAADPRIREPALALLRDALAADTNANANANPLNPANPPGIRGPSPADRKTETLDRALRPRLEAVGYRLAHLVATNLTLVSGSSRGRFRGRPAVLEEHVARYTELFTSGQPVLITPFRPRRSGGPGGPGRPPDFLARGITNFGARPWGGPRGEWNGSTPPGENRGPGPGPGGTNRPPSRGRFPGEGPPGMPRGDLTLMQVAVPIRDDDGQLLGAFALVIDPEREFTRILSVARSGVSGETYALDQRGLLISRSRFDDQLRRLGLINESPDSTSALNLRLADPGVDQPTAITPDDPTNPSRPLARLAAAAVAGTNGVEVVPSRDYRGIPVVGAWKWLPEHGFGVVTQINASEAYQSLRVLNFLFLILFLLLLLCSTGMLLLSHANRVWRRRLSEAELRLRQLGQYTLQERIGEGAMGVVYRARHGLMRRDTAVKLLVPDRADAASIERFEREVCLSCQLSHPNTIQVFDYGRTPDGIFYYAMEYLRGVNLHQLVARYGAQPEARVIHILNQVCDSLGEAHALGLVHRDIKPANVFLCHRGGIPDCIKVLDFGLVREFRSGDTRPAETPSAIEGTPSFISPEAIHQRSPIDPRSDLYSVGALGYYLVSGEPVFEAQNVSELYEKHLSERPAPLCRRIAQPISPEFEKLLLDCLEKEPSLRPSTAAELRARLATLPEATRWNKELAAAWWNQHPEARTSTPVGLPSPNRQTDPTLRVDLSHRNLG